MNETDCCRVCGQKRPADAPSGLCPTCLLKAGLAVHDSEMEDVTILFGPASSSVLQAFGAAYGKIPPVLLRDADSVTGPEPVIRPSSEEIPDTKERSARLQIFGEIARGGMGAVLKGRDADLGRDLAVKILLDSHRDKPEMVRRFIEEAQIAGQLQHPGIVPVYELGAFSDRRPYFAMKLVKGQTLAHILAARTSPNDGLPRLLSIFESICQTMAYAHARGVIHRDLKPSNVMVGSFGEVQVMDWGLAKVLPRGGAVDDASAGQTKDHATVIATARSEADLDLSQPGSILGTPAYMAPEQARGEIDQVDERADVFALGSIFCELLTGQPAFTGRNGGEIQRKAARGELADAMARLNRTDHGHDSELIALCKICLAPEPEDRPKDASEIAKRIGIYHSQVQERLRKSEIAIAEEKARAEEVTKRATVERHRFRLIMALAASVLGMILMGSGGWAYVSHQQAFRQAATEKVVTEAIDKATLLHGQAKAALIEDLSKWSEALAAANEARASMEAGEPSVVIRSRVNKLLKTLENERADATQRAAEFDMDKKLFERLDAIRVNSADASNPQKIAIETDAAYAKNFREFGIDVDALDSNEAARLFKQRSAPLEFATRLDDWVMIRKEALGKDRSDSWRNLVSIAMATDRDPWRNSLRSLIGTDNHAEARRLCDDDEELNKQPARSLYLLAQILESTRGGNPHEYYHNESVEVLKRAWRLSPNDSQICRSLVVHSKNDSLRLRFATAAVAASPESPNARQRLAKAFLPSGATDGVDSWNEMTVNDGSSIEGKRGYKIQASFPNSQPDDEVVTIRHGLRFGFQTKEGQGILIGPMWKFEPSDITPEALNDAIAEFRAAIRMAPHDPAIHMDLAHALVLKGEYDDAVKEHQLAVHIDPTYPTSWNGLENTLYLKGELNRAIELINQKIQRNSTVDDYKFLGLMYHEQGKKELAFSAYREGLLRDQEDITARQTATVMETGKPDEVISLLQELIKAHPQNEEIRESLEIMLKRQNTPEQ